MNKKTVALCIFLLLIPIIGLLVHVFYLQHAITQAYEGQADSFTGTILNILYPRFEVEKNRFDLIFFLQKSNQVVYRFTFIYYILLGSSYFINRYESFRDKINNYRYTFTTPSNIDILRILFFLYLIYLSFELCHDLMVLQSVKQFYKPVLWLRLLKLPFPDFTTIILLGSIWTFLNIMVLVNIRPIICSFLSFFLFVSIQSFALSFEKIDHGYVTITYAFMVLPFLLLERDEKIAPFYSWSLQLIRIVLAMIYFLSALEKIFISKLAWVSASTLQGYLSLHESYLSKILMQYDGLCLLISSFTLLFQLSFILIIFFPRYKWIWIIGGILFHYGTLLVMNIGHPLNPWVITYIFFIDWTKVYHFLDGAVRKENFFSS